MPIPLISDTFTDGFVRLWDMRQPTDPTLVFSESETVDNSRPSPLLSCIFSPTVPNLLLTHGASLQDRPRFWNLSCSKTPSESSHWTLLSQQEGSKFSKQPASVAFVNLPRSQSKTCAMSVSKDGVPEFLEAPQRHSLAWNIHNDMAALAQEVRIFGPKAHDPSPSPGRSRRDLLKADSEDGNTLDKDIGSTMQARLQSGYSVNVSCGRTLNALAYFLLTLALSPTAHVKRIPN